jgi:hypothetical protein
MMKTANFQPEILNDELFYLIIELVKDKKPKTIIEIGSATGLGSTQAFIKGITEGNIEATLCCIESVSDRFEALKENTAKHEFVRCIRASSVPLSQLMTESQVEQFWKSHTTLGIHSYPLKMVQGWRREDTQEAAGIPENGIRLANTSMGCDVPDMALIDGSAFSGHAELRALWGTKTIILDDVMDIKNFDSYHRLVQDTTYTLAKENHKYRNGYAVFEIKS